MSDRFDEPPLVVSSRAAPPPITSPQHQHASPTKQHTHHSSHSPLPTRSPILHPLSSPPSVPLVSSPSPSPSPSRGVLSPSLPKIYLHPDILQEVQAQSARSSHHSIAASSSSAALPHSARVNSNSTTSSRSTAHKARSMQQRSSHISNSAAQLLNNQNTNIYYSHHKHHSSNSNSNSFGLSITSPPSVQSLHSPNLSPSPSLARVQGAHSSAAAPSSAASFTHSNSINSLSSASQLLITSSSRRSLQSSASIQSIPQTIIHRTDNAHHKSSSQQLHSNNHSSSKLLTRLYPSPPPPVYVSPFELTPFSPRKLERIPLPNGVVAQWMAMLYYEMNGGATNINQIKTHIYQQIIMEIEKSHQSNQQSVLEAITAENTRVQGEVSSYSAEKHHTRDNSIQQWGGRPIATQLPSLLQMPMTHVAFVVDTFFNICVSHLIGRSVDILRYIGDELIEAIYQGYIAGKGKGQLIKAQMRGQQREEEENKCNDIFQSMKLQFQKINGSKGTEITHYEIVPYFHVSYLLNQEYHKGVKLIERYVEKQKMMHVQSLRRADVLEGAVHRLQRALITLVFQRWHEVVQQRKRQKKAFRHLFSNYHTSLQHLHSHFLSWQSRVFRAVTIKAEAQATELIKKFAKLKVEIAESRRLKAEQEDKLQQISVQHTHIHREKVDLESQLDGVNKLAEELEAKGTPKTASSAFDLILLSLASLSHELDIARSLNLQDPLRILTPSRTTYIWDEVYKNHPYGSYAWAVMRRQELDRWKEFFLGTNEKETKEFTASVRKRGDINTLNVASTQASDSADSSPSTPTSSLPPPPVFHQLNSNYHQEVEILLLWMNFHLIQAQIRSIKQQQENKEAKEKQKQQETEESKRKRIEAAKEKRNRRLNIDGDNPVLSPTQRTKSVIDSIHASNLASISKKRRSSLQRGLGSISSNLNALLEASMQYASPHAYHLASVIRQFHSGEALARRVENLTSSLQDSELMLRLLGEIAPQVTDMDMLTHIDLETRSKLLIKMLESLNPDFSGIVTHLDFVHAFHSDRVAALLCNLMIDYPNLPIQGGWFDEQDHSNQILKPILIHTNVSLLQQQLKESEDFGPLNQLQFEVIQLQQLLHQRLKLTRTITTDLHEQLKGIVVKGRRILEDAYDRHRLWQALRIRLKSFMSSVFVAHLRGQPILLDDPRAIKEKEHFCNCFENPMTIMREKEKEQEERKRRSEKEPSFAFTSSFPDPRELFTNLDIDSAFPYGRPQLRFFDMISKLNRTAHDDKNIHQMMKSGTASSSTADLNATGEITINLGAIFDNEHLHDEHDEQPRSNSLNNTQTLSPPLPPVTSLPLSTLDENARFLDPIRAPVPGEESEGNSQLATPMPGSSSGRRPSTSAPANSSSASTILLRELSFELHLIQQFLYIYYDSLKNIWKAYAQMDTSESGRTIDGSNTLNLMEYWSFIKDIGIVSTNQNPHGFTPKQVENIFLEVFMSQNERKDKIQQREREYESQMFMSPLYTASASTPLSPPSLSSSRVTPRGSRASSPTARSRAERDKIVEKSPEKDTEKKDKQPIDKDSLQLDERGFVEVLIRLAFYRKISKHEKHHILAEWKKFQLERKLQLEKERRLREEREEFLQLSRAATPTPDAPPPDDDTNPFFDNLLAPDSLHPSHPSNTTPRPSRPTSPNHSQTPIGYDEAYGCILDSSTSFGLSLRFFGLLIMKVLPKASKISIDTFRVQYKNMEVSKIFRRHGNPLRKLFYKYATLHSVKVNQVDGEYADSWSNTIDYNEFVQLLKDLHLLHDRGLDLTQVYSIFANVQQDLHVKQTDLINVRTAYSLKKGLGEKSREELAKERKETRERRRREAEELLEKKRRDRELKDSYKENEKERSKKKKTRKKKKSSSVNKDDASLTSPTSSGEATVAPVASVSSDDDDNDNDDVDSTSRNELSMSKLNDELSETDSEEEEALIHAHDHDDENEDDEKEENEIGDDEAYVQSLKSDSNIVEAPSQITDHDEMIYPEYLEALAAIACFRYPNPYRPVGDKLTLFLTRDVLPYISDLTLDSGPNIHKR